MNDNMDVDLQGILKKRTNGYNENSHSIKKSTKRVRIELPIGEDSDSDDSSKISSPKKRRGINNQNEILPFNIPLKNQNNISSNNQQQLLSQSNNNDEYNKKNRIVITPKSSLISQKLKTMKYNSKYNNGNNINKNGFSIGNSLSSQNDSNTSKELNNQFSFSNRTPPSSINFFNNNNNKFKNSLSASLSPSVNLSSSLNSPISFSFPFSSSLPTSFTFHSSYKSNNNSFSSNTCNDSNGFSFNYTPNNLISNTIQESDENNSKDILNNYRSNNSLNQINMSNSSLSSNSNEENENKNNLDIDDDDDDDTDVEKQKNSLLSKIARQSFEAEKKRYMQHHKDK
ncbi:hypothetical protein H8356DRAFT_1667731 [Neocallimastix lanati (nom. inval.)]|nr:hypothetical protein H8356DRAFT_1667731 [Neocallimastix sp. JGI-2020a]